MTRFRQTGTGTGTRTRVDGSRSTSSDYSTRIKIDGSSSDYSNLNVPQGRDGRVQDPSVNTNISTNIHPISPVDVNLTLLAGTCLHVASKLEDVSYMGLRDMAALMTDFGGIDGPCALDGMLALEERLLNRDDFNIYIATVIDFLYVYFECFIGLKEIQSIQHMSTYLSELTLLFPDQISEKYNSSLVAISVLCYAMAYSEFKYDGYVVECLSLYSRANISECIRSIHSAHNEISNSHRSCAVFGRYDSPRYTHVSTLPAMSPSALNSLMVELRKPP